MRKDAWLCCEEVTRDLVVGSPPSSAMIRLSEYRDSAVEHLCVHCFAIPPDSVSTFLMKSTFQDEGEFEEERGNLQLLHLGSPRFLCKAFADQFRLTFCGGTCRRKDGTLVAVRQKGDNSLDQFVEADVRHVSDFLRARNYVLLRCLYVSRCSERLQDEFDFSDIKSQRQGKHYHYKISIDNKCIHFRMHTRIALFGKTIVRI